MIEHESPVSGVTTCNQKYIATAGYDNKLILWDKESNKAIAVGHHDHLVNQCIFSRCGNYLASSSSDYSLRIWSVPEMRLLSVMYHDDDVEGVSFHPTEDWVASSSRDHTVRVFDLNGQCLKLFKGHTADVISVEWSELTSELISSSDDGTIKRWSMDNDSYIRNINLGGIETDTIAITSEGKIFAGNDDGNIIVLDSEGEMISEVKAHAGGVKKLAYDRVHKRLISLSYDRTFKLWDASNPELIELRKCEFPNLIWARSCCFLSEHELVFGTFGSSYAVYDLKANSWNLDHIHDTPGVNNVLVDHTGIYTIGDAGILKKYDVVINKLPSLCNFLTRIGELIVTGGQEGALYNALTGEKIYQFIAPLNCATVTEMNDTRVLVCGAYSGEALFFEYADNTLIFVFSKRLHSNAIKGISAQGDCLFSVSADKSVTWFSLSKKTITKKDTETNKLIVNGCTALGKNKFASISRERKLVIWEDSIPQIFSTPHKNSIKCIAYSPAYNTIATGDYRGGIGLFNVEKKEYVFTLRPTIHGISSIFYDKDRNKFIASSYDGKYYSVDIAI